MLDHQVAVDLVLGNLTADQIWSARDEWICKGCLGMSRIIYNILESQGLQDDRGSDSDERRKNRKAFDYSEKLLITELAADSTELFIPEWCSQMIGVKKRLENPQNYIRYGEIFAGHPDIEPDPNILYRARVEDICTGDQQARIRLQTRHKYSGMICHRDDKTGEYLHISMFPEVLEDKSPRIRYEPCRCISIDLAEYAIQHGSAKQLEKLFSDMMKKQDIIGCMILSRAGPVDIDEIYRLLAGQIMYFDRENFGIITKWARDNFENIMDSSTGVYLLRIPGMAEELGQAILDYARANPGRARSILSDIAIPETFSKPRVNASDMYETTSAQLFSQFISLWSDTDLDNAMECVLYTGDLARDKKLMIAREMIRRADDKEAAKN